MDGTRYQLFADAGFAENQHGGRELCHPLHEIPRALGKALAARYSEVMIQFRCPAHLMFPLPPGKQLQCNRVKIVLQPNEGIQLNFQTKVPEVDGVAFLRGGMTS